MYKVVSECNNNEVWASGFYSKDKANIEDYSQRDTDVPHKTSKK